MFVMHSSINENAMIDLSKDQLLFFCLTTSLESLNQVYDISQIIAEYNGELY